MIRLLLIAFFLIFAIKIPAQEPINRSETAAKALADSLYGLLAKGENFAKLVKQFSEDPGTRKDGGIMRNVEKGMMVQEFEDVMVNLQVNEISKPFKTQYGYHIAQLMERKGDTFTIRHILIRCN